MRLFCSFFKKRTKKSFYSFRVETLGLMGEALPVATAAWVASVAAFAVSMSWSPGPNNVMVTASGATFGFRRTIWHMLGISVGFPVMLMAVALGASEVLQSAPWLQGALRWAGVAYMLWLAWRIGSADPDPGTVSAGSSGGKPLSFLGAALFQWVNPKAWVIALGAVATYTTATGLALVAQSAAVAAIFCTVTLPAVAFWTMVGVGAAQVLRTRRAVRAFNCVMAALLIASLIPMLLSA